MTATRKRNPRIAVSFTAEEIGLILARSGNDPASYLKALALRDIGSDDPTCRQFYALDQTLNEALSGLISEAEDPVPDRLIHQLEALRNAMRTLQRQAVMEQRMDIRTILQQLHEAVGGNKLSPIEPPMLPPNPGALLRELGEGF